MNILKKTFALLMALALVLSLAVPAMATGTGYTITITDKYENHIYEAYQIFSGDYHENILSNVKWGASFNSAKAGDFLTALQNDSTFVSGSVNLFSTVTHDPANPNATADAIAAKMVGWERDSAMVVQFAKIVHDYTKDAVGNITYTYLTTPAGTSGTPATVNIDGVPHYQYKIEDLSGGYYMVKDKDKTQEGEYDYYTRLILHVAGDLSITPKGGIPSVDKKVHASIDGTFVEQEDVSLTDTFYFKLEGTMPSNLEQYDTYTYEFVDTMSDMLVFSTEEFPNYAAFAGIAAIYVERVGSDNSIVTVPLTLTTDATAADDNDFSTSGDYDKRTNLLLATDPSNIHDKADVLITKTGNTLTIRFLDLRHSLPGLVSTDKIIIKYAAKLDSDAAFGTGGTADGTTPNVNNVVLNFSNNPQGDGMGTTPPADAKVYVYQLNLVKTNDLTGSELKNLPGAQFMLYQQTLDENDNITYKYAVFTKSGDQYTIKDWITLSQGVKILSDSLEEDENATINYAFGTDKEHPLKDANGHGLDAAGNKVTASPVGIVVDSLVATTGTDGKLNIKGLDATDYFLQELRAPSGYNKLANDTKISVTPGYTNGALTSLKVTSGGKDAATNITDGSGTVTITNSMGTVLPSTGGIGTTIFYAVGGLLVVAAVTLLITKKRMA